MAISLFCLSVLLMAFTMRYKQIALVSPYSLFLLFQLLYNLTPWIICNILADSPLHLLQNTSLIDKQLLLSSSANLCFALVHFLFHRPTSWEGPAKRRYPTFSRSSYILLLTPLFVITCALCHSYGWHQSTFAGYEGAEIGGMFVVAAYSKYLFVAGYLYYLYLYGLDDGAWVLFAEQIVVMAVDGARTTFLPVAVLTVILASDRLSSKGRVRICVGFLSMVLLSIGTRAAVVRGDSIWSKMLVPVTVEGVMGDYPALQTLDALRTGPLHLTFGSSYVVDPLVWLVPGSEARAKYETLQAWIDTASNKLDEPFAPMGGFYYLAEAVSAFGYPGPIIITALFAGSLVWVDRRKNTHRLLYLAWTSTVAVLFIKTIFGNSIKLFVIELLFLYGFASLGRLMFFLKDSAPAIERSPLKLRIDTL